MCSTSSDLTRSVERTAALLTSTSIMTDVEPAA